MEMIRKNYLIPDSKLILTIPLSPFEYSDSWFWHYNSNGCYSVRSGNNIAINESKADPSSSSDVMAE